MLFPSPVLEGLLFDQLLQFLPAAVSAPARARSKRRILSFFFLRVVLITMSEPLSAVVVDNGSHSVKAGFGGEDAPRVEIPSVVGRARHPGASGILLCHGTDNFVGKAAVANRGLLTLTRPIQQARITHWQEVQELWHATFLTSLQVTPEEHPLLITEAPDNTRADREKMAELLFEMFNCPALVVRSTSVLSLFSTGRSTGLVVDSGVDQTCVGPVWDGYAMPHNLRRLDIGGDTLTSLLRSRLRTEGYPFSTDADFSVVEKMKEQLCYCAGKAESELKLCKESKTIERFFNLPDGEHVYMNEQRFMVPEALFNPSLVENATHVGLHTAIHEAIQKCHPDMRHEMYSSVVLGGGNTLFPKLDERVQQEVSYLAPKNCVVKCVAFPDRKYSAWMGGSILGSLSTFPCMWVSKNEYDDYGASIVHRKC